MQNIKWGIIGCGGIAERFVTSLNALDAGELLACASKSPGRGQSFADKHGIDTCCVDYDALVKDPEIDAVYVATTHNFHYENIKRCLENGKHVLCEKPLTVNAAQSEELMALAHQKNLFLMEALWTRFLPAVLKLQEVLAEGIIGEVRSVHADLCFFSDCGPEHRLRNKALAGGALLDIGVYPINFASIVFGEQPLRMLSSAVIGETGVDESSYYLFEYEGGRRATLSSSFTHAAPSEAVVCGTNGFIRIPHFLGAAELHIHPNGKDSEILEFPRPDEENFKYEIAHAMECIAAGKIESDVMPHRETVAIMKTMDMLRAQWGLQYPGE